ncbi:hypothetical protein BCV69DRAFT_285241 [Microstroma glucosiphilum]|uniref:Uncharacterized protein n=1 Tax=Pseudomicrostroma glucosiphilum TaxID=1684307 RepID=A0A316TY94_9BASI|nr:hypothetical protein BCV69DRAFT_285241 [Pseudomicrostroma glucosiphilum]PWN18266.1 hypothetical protein BCV69DRAFT_285241 [Pseudomicrostroma glucosiphilum]
MITTHFWQSGQPDRFCRPAGSESFRQVLARKGGDTHFQLASNAMAPSSSRLTIATAPAAHGSHNHNHNGPSLPVSSIENEEVPRHTARSTRRGRSPTRRHLWAYSPERAHAEVQEERRQSITSRFAPDVQPASYPETVPPQTANEIPVSSLSLDSPISALSSSSTLTTTQYEAPPVTNTSLPILSRPPAALASHTSLELRAWQAGEAFDGELSYLRAASITSDTQTTGAGPAAFAQVLYTRSHLPELDLQSRYLWHALHYFRVQDNDYAKGYAERAGKAPRFDSAVGVCPFLAATSSSSSSAPHSTRDPNSSAAIIFKTFNWSSLRLPLSLQHEWYGVTFRSIRRAASASLSLYQADRLSHEEAVSSGGLILYWYGQPDAETGENLATCIWTSREEAREASRLPMHKAARDLAVEAYETFELERYRVVKREGESGIRIEPWN